MLKNYGGKSINFILCNSICQYQTILCNYAVAIYSFVVQNCYSILYMLPKFLPIRSE